MCVLLSALPRQFSNTETQFPWVTQSRHGELPRKLPRFCAAGSELWRSLANVIFGLTRVRHVYFYRILPSKRTSPNATEHLRNSGPARTRTEDQGIHFSPAVSGGSGLSLHPRG